jgi:hypothetical protein
MACTLYLHLDALDNSCNCSDCLQLILQTCQNSQCNRLIISMSSSSSSTAQSSSSSPNVSQRFPLTGTIDEIGSDLKRTKEIGVVEHIVFGYNFLLIGKDVDKMMDTTKQESNITPSAIFLCPIWMIELCISGRSLIKLFIYLALPPDGQS